ncbi:MAG: FG-GAP-like repeat-containing protein, partial [Flavobacteriaceae bacterium]
DGDNQNDLIVVGEWMSPRIFYHTPNGFKESVNEKLKSKKGFWNRIVKGDFNSDGLPDFAITNYGLNSQLKTPLTLFYDDFDNNGSIDPILCITKNNEYYPYWSKDDLLSQLNSLKSKYVSYTSYASEPLKNILNENQLRDAKKIEVNTFASSVVLNLGNDEFDWTSLPTNIQMAPLYGIAVVDADQDDKEDLVLGGNLFGTRARFGRFDASKGEFLKGNGDGTFEVVSYVKSGLKIEGEVRDIVPIQLNQKPHLLIGRNNNSIKIFAIRD